MNMFGHVYFKTDKHHRSLTKGKLYTVVEIHDDYSFYIVNDYGNKIFCLWEGCAFLNCGKWFKVMPKDIVMFHG